MNHCKISVFWAGLYYKLFPEVYFRGLIYHSVVPIAIIFISVSIYMISFIYFDMELRDNGPRERPGYQYCIYCDAHTKTFMFHSQVYGACINMSNITAYLFLQGSYSIFIIGAAFLTGWRIYLGTPEIMSSYMLFLD